MTVPLYDSVADAKQYEALPPRNWPNRWAAADLLNGLVRRGHRNPELLGSNLQRDFPGATVNFSDGTIVEGEPGTHGYRFAVWFTFNVNQVRSCAITLLHQPPAGEPAGDNAATLIGAAASPVTKSGFECWPALSRFVTLNDSEVPAPVDVDGAALVPLVPEGFLPRPVKTLITKLCGEANALGYADPLMGLRKWMADASKVLVLPEGPMHAGLLVPCIAVADNLGGEFRIVTHSGDYLAWTPALNFPADPTMRGSLVLVHGRRTDELTDRMLG